MSYLATHEAAKNQVDLYHNLRNFLTLNCSTEFRENYSAKNSHLEMPSLCRILSLKKNSNPCKRPPSLKTTVTKYKTN